jgi:hypothetical protein
MHPPGVSPPVILPRKANATQRKRLLTSVISTIPDLRSLMLVVYVSVDIFGGSESGGAMWALLRLGMVAVVAARVISWDHMWKGEDILEGSLCGKRRIAACQSWEW